MRLFSFPFAETVIQKIPSPLILATGLTLGLVACSLHFNKSITEKLMRCEALNIVKEISKIRVRI